MAAFNIGNISALNTELEEYRVLLEYLEQIFVILAPVLGLGNDVVFGILQIMVMIDEPH